MYSSGADEVKKWMIALKRIDESGNIKEEDEENKGEEKEEEEEKTPFDILEQIRELVNSDLKNPDDDDEINKILKKVAKEVKGFYDKEEEERERMEKEKAKQPPPQPNPNQQQTQPANTNLPTNQPGSQGYGDVGANTPNDMALSMGGGLGTPPPAGGQM